MFTGSAGIKLCDGLIIRRSWVRSPPAPHSRDLRFPGRDFEAARTRLARQGMGMSSGLMNWLAAGAADTLLPALVLPEPLTFLWIAPEGQLGWPGLARRPCRLTGRLP